MNFYTWIIFAIPIRPFRYQIFAPKKTFFKIDPFIQNLHIFSLKFTHFFSQNLLIFSKLKKYSLAFSTSNSNLTELRNGRDDSKD